MSFDRNLKAFMRLKKVTQTALAETLKVSPQAVQQWCAGKTRPNLKRVKEIAEMLDTSPGVLLYGFNYLDSEKEPLYPDVENEDDENVFSERLAYALAKSNLPVEMIANLVGVSRDQLLKWTQTDFPSEIRLKKLAEALGVSVRWLAVGDGKPNDGRVEVIDGNADDEYVRITAMRGKEIPPELTMVRTLEIDPEYLKQCCPRSDPKNLAIFTVSGDSMSPTLPHGSVVLVDLSVHSLVTDSLYVVGYGDFVSVKRLQGLPGNQMTVINDNPLYPPITIDLKEEGIDFKIYGRVVCLWYKGRN